MNIDGLSLEQIESLIATNQILVDALKLCEGNVSSLAGAHPQVYGVWLDVIRAALNKAGV